MRELTQRNVVPITPSQALFLTALLAVSAASERTRRVATGLFERGALSVEWAILSRNTESRVSWLRLASVTHEATRHFLGAWPAIGATSVASMLSALEISTSAVASRDADTTVPSPTSSPWGVLALLTHAEQLQLLRCVEGALTPAHLCALYAAVELECSGTPHHHAASGDVANAIEALESLLLGSCVSTLETPADIGRGPLAA